MQGGIVLALMVLHTLVLWEQPRRSGWDVYGHLAPKQMCVLLGVTSGCFLNLPACEAFCS